MLALIRNVLAITLGLVGQLLLLPLALVISPLILVAHGTRSLAKRIEPHHQDWADLIEFDGTFGWRPVANMEGWHMVDDLYQISTDCQGWRGKQSIDDAEMIVVGDSFAWGYGVNDKDFFGDLVPNIRTKAIGCVGYNMVQELMWLEQLSLQLEGKVVIWMIYLGNDPYDNLNPHMDGYRSPFVCKPAGADEWSVRDDHVTPDRWFFKGKQGMIYLEKVNELCRPGYYSDRAFEACRFLLTKGSEICRAAGAELIVVSVPERSQYDIEMLRSFDRFADANSVDPGLPDAKLGNICADLDIPFKDTMSVMDLSDFKQTDCHWNEAGHQKFASLLHTLFTQYSKSACT